MSNFNELSRRLFVMLKPMKQVQGRHVQHDLADSNNCLPQITNEL
jgi:hypothetical protein